MVLSGRGGYHLRLEEEWVAQPRGLDVWTRRPAHPNCDRGSAELGGVSAEPVSGLSRASARGACHGGAHVLVPLPPISQIDVNDETAARVVLAQR